MTLALCALFCIFISKSILWRLCQTHIEKSPTKFTSFSEAKYFQIQILASDEYLPTTALVIVTFIVDAGQMLIFRRDIHVFAGAPLSLNKGTLTDLLNEKTEICCETSANRL